MAMIYEDVNYANAKEQIRIFWTVTIPPKCRRITNTITKNILRAFDLKLRCRLDVSNIPALEETAKEHEERSSRMLERGGLSIGEYRETNGFEVDPDDPWKDKRVMTSNLVPLDDFFMPPPEEDFEEEEDDEGAPPDTAGPGFVGDDVQGEERGNVPSV